MANAEDLRALGSLLSKSEKAAGKLAKGTWQAAMLGQNIAALRLAVALLEGSAADAGPIQCGSALEALDSMLDKTLNARARFEVGTAQRTLQERRLRGLLAARAAVERALAARGPERP